MAPVYLLPYPENLLSTPVPHISSDTELVGAVRASERRVVQKKAFS